jgi:predicted phage-related endonuclease
VSAVVSIPREESDRRSGIGASESAPIVLGVDRFGRSAADVYAAKVLDDRKASSPNQALQRGNLLEPAVVAWYAAETGNAPKFTGAAQRTIRSADHPWLFATPDGLLPDRVVEAKTSMRRDGWGEPGTNEIPLEYLIQAHHQMLCSNLRLTDMPVLFGSFEFALFVVPFEQELADMIVAETGKFWTEHVLVKVPPPSRTVGDAEILYRRDSGVIQVATPDLADAIAQLRAAKAITSAAEAAEAILAEQVKAAMGEAATLVDVSGDPLATWKNNKPSLSFDAAQFRADHPATFTQYQRERPGARVFRVVQPKES